MFLSSSALRPTGIEPAEGQALLPFLLAHASSPNYAVDFGWKTGDFVVWENQATWHFAVNDYEVRAPTARSSSADPGPARL
jgi:alpha-ketoglutarate-dependent taurine dioxygenase